MAYSDVLGANLGGPAVTEASSDVGFPSQMLLGEFLARIKDLECRFGYLPDNFLSSLLGKVINSPDYSLYLSSDAILVSLRSFRSRLLDPMSPLPGSSRDSDSVILFLWSLLGVANPYPPVSSGGPSACAPGDSGLSVSVSQSVATGWSPGLHFSAPVFFAPLLVSGVASSVSEGGGGRFFGR